MIERFNKNRFDFSEVRCVLFDFGFTLSSERYFNVYPPGCPNWQRIIQSKVFSNNQRLNDWMKGMVSLSDIAELLSDGMDHKPETIIKYMKKGCQNLSFNKAVLSFALQVRQKCIPTAIVTRNMDVFSDVVVPSHRLDRIFDAILNSSEYAELDKEILWLNAFEQLGTEINYKNSLLLDDESKNINKFRANGGFAYHYHNDPEFRNWLDEFGWETFFNTKDNFKQIKI